MIPYLGGNQLSTCTGMRTYRVASSCLLSQLNGFLTLWCSTPFGSEATQAKRWLSANHDPICRVGPAARESS